MYDFKYLTFNNDNKISNIVFFIHGYNAHTDDFADKLELLASKLTNTLIVVPISNMASEKNKKKKQWFSMMDIDPTRERKNPSLKVAEVVDIYNKFGDRIHSTANDLNQFISKIQTQYNINDNKTYLMGFSQGAMIALYTAYTRSNLLGGVFSIAGIICGKDILEKELKSRPKTYLMHGKSDVWVQYKTHNYTKCWLKNHNIDFKSFKYDDTDHFLTAQEILDIAEIIG